jgi:signal transduction histidine kinase
MRYAESPYLADLFAISFRWLALFGLALSLGIGDGLQAGEGTIDLVKVAVLALPVLWNSFVAALALFNRRLAWHRQINLALDLLFATLLFAFCGGLPGPIAWVAVLPLFTGALYFGARGALPAALIVSLLQAGCTYLTNRPLASPQAIGLLAGFNLVAGLSVTLLSAPLIGTLRRSYQKTVTQRKEGERKAQRQERDRMKALFEMIETFSSTLNYQKVLNYALDTAINAAGSYNGSAEQLVGAVLLFGEQKDLEVMASRGFAQRDSSIHLPAGQGILSEVLKTGASVLLENPRQDPELAGLLTVQEQAAAVCLPLIRGMTAYGVMLFAHSHPGYFTAERVETLQMLCNQAVISLQNARLYHDLAREKERIIQTQEETQKKLSRDLHDGPTQSISAIAMRAEIARKLLEKSPQEAGEELARIEEMARRTTQEIRHMLFTMRPLVLESEGLAAALQTMADKLSELYGQKVVVDVEEAAARQLDSSRQSVVFALAEEAVNNARKHAQASEIWVRLKVVPQNRCVILLEILDNGVGFDVESVMNSYDRRGSLGMVHLQERTDLVNGQIRINSVQGKGTRIQVFIPLDEAAADSLQHQR